MEQKRSTTAPADCVVVEGINARGFGTVPKAVMRDTALPIEAKGIYAYLCSFAGGGQTAFPSRATMLAELGLSKDRYYKYRQMLVDRGLLRIEHRSSGSVQRPVRTNVYVLAATMPACYRESAENAPEPPDGKGETARERSPQRASARILEPTFPQVAKDVPKTRTSSEGFPQSPGHEGRPGFKDVLETGTFNRPGNQDAEDSHIPSSRTANGEDINNRLQITSIPSVQSSCSQEGIGEGFAELSSPALTPNRNRIRDARAPYADLRASFPADVVAAAWRRRQGDAREGHKPARFYPQLAKWLESPDSDGARAMCEEELARREKGAATRLSVLLSLDERYMALLAEADDLEARLQGGQEDPAADERLNAVRAEMSSIRNAKRAKLPGAGQPACPNASSNQSQPNDSTTKE